MRIAQIAPLDESVPPALYGGTERVVSYLTEELVRLGHEVTLYASGDSRTKAKLVSVVRRSLRLNSKISERIPYYFLLMERLSRDAEHYDVIHAHMDLLFYPFGRRFPVPHISTLHGRLDLEFLHALYREYSETPVVSISDAQRKPLPWLNWQATVHHGLPTGMYTPQYHPKGDYCAFVGRISPEKRVDRAIEITRRAGIKLKIAAKIDEANEDYFRREIQGLFKEPHVEFMGEVGEGPKAELLREARALLFPIDWPEPFGMVMIESMACATPIIAYPCGSVPEIVREGENGFIVRNVDEAVAALSRIEEIDRGACRRDFEERFSVSRMARDYMRIYEWMIALSPRPIHQGASLGRHYPF